MCLDRGIHEYAGRQDLGLCKKSHAAGNRLTAADSLSTCVNGRWIFFEQNLVLPKKISESINSLKALLKPFGVKITLNQEKLNFSGNGRTTSFLLGGEDFDFTKAGNKRVLGLDYLVTSGPMIAAMALSKLNLNKKIFARNCTVKKIDKQVAVAFLDQYHLMGATQSATNLGLFSKDELLAVASFSKGRKMNRLPDDQRSFELIRFCSRPGITITGGLSKMLKAFSREKKAGDIMTYVDKQFSDGSSFISAGFKRHSETAPNFFLVNRKTLERSFYPDRALDFDKRLFYLTRNPGNIKLIYQPLERT